MYEPQTDSEDYKAGLRNEAVLDPSYRELFIKRGYLDLSMSDLFYARLDPLDLGEIPPPEDGDALPSSVELALGDLGTTYSCSRPLYRARVYETGRTTPFSPEELGAPPRTRAPAGRANRAGEPVLYVATDFDTAIAEVRARTGQYVGAASIRLARPQRILNLVRLPYLKSPFFEDSLRWKAEALELLGDFGEELSKPATADDATEQYRVSQEACDAIHSFDGLAYPSGRGPGHNVVFFTPDAGRVTTRRILRFDAPDSALTPVDCLA